MTETTDSVIDPHRPLIQDEIDELGLRPHVDELDSRGYTVVPPAVANPGGFIERMLDACLDIAERRTGVRPDLDSGNSRIDSPVGDVLKAVLLEDPVFEEALMNPALLALATYLCGYDVVLSSLSVSLKGRSGTDFNLHTDTRLPSPLPTQALLCKGIYTLTDFDRHKGSTVFVPGSHKWCRNPGPEETDVEGSSDTNAVPVDAQAGSLIFFHGNTWHGAFNREAQGLRISVHLLMTRPLLRTTEDFIGRIPQEMLDRNPARFAVLTQQGIVPGYTDKDDELNKVKNAMAHRSAFEKEAGIKLPLKV